MIQQALQRLQKEIAEHHNNPYVSMVGGELIKYVRAHPEQAQRFLAAGKSIRGSLDAMRRVAQTKISGQLAVITPEDAMAVVMNYYGVQQPQQDPPPVEVGLHVDLDELLL